MLFGIAQAPGSGIYIDCNMNAPFKLCGVQLLQLNMVSLDSGPRAELDLDWWEGKGQVGERYRIV